MMDPETELFVIDPVGGMSDLVEAVDGHRIQVGGGTTINPMEIEQGEYGRSEAEADLDPYQQKIRSVMGLFHTHFEGRRELTKEEEGLLRRAVRLSYLQNGITPNPETHDRESPTIGDVIEILERYNGGDTAADFMSVDEDADEEVKRYVQSVKRTESESDNQQMQEIAFNLLMGLEEFKEGGQNDDLNGRPEELEFTDRVIQFDLSQAAEGNADLMMHVVLDRLFQKARSTDSNTLVVIDEAHYMLGESEALDMLELFARHSRHYDAGMTLISQTVDEFMKNEQTQAIYDQCDIRALMRHENIGDEALEALDLTERERQFVLGAQAGNSADYSQSLLHVTDVGTLRLQVISSEYEHHVIEESESAWAYLEENDMVSYADVPDERKPEIHDHQPQRSTGDD
ncbi:MAG: hypothetical protein ABEI99_05195 [Halobaculum sp.]